MGQAPGEFALPTFEVEPKSISEWFLSVDRKGCGKRRRQATRRVSAGKNAPVLQQVGPR